MDRVIVSDEAVITAANSPLGMNREKRRAIRNFSVDQLQRYIVDIYRSGFQDGCDAVIDKINSEYVEKVNSDVEEIQVDWEDVLSLISQVKGVGPKILNAIDQKLKENY